MSKISFKNKKVLITGGASGIGKIMVRKALERGASELIVWDINEEGLKTLKKDLITFEARLKVYTIDLSNMQELMVLADRIKQEIGVIDILINNAGIIVGKYFLDHTANEISRTLLVNTEALMQITLTFLPGMLAQNFGAICNIASSAGLVSSPKMSVYVASKWAIVGWSDSIRLELLQQKKEVAVTTIMPYYINTGMFDGVRSRLLPILEPERVAEKIILAIEKRTRMLAMPLPYWFIRLAQGLFPLSIYEWIMGKIFGIYDAMNDFKGKK
ncbi:SDR family NAD(P)-dependent oxidoreductase [Flavobacterium columnare]|uniref:SDR family NAD(P)-dependent oxidoreductase n=1 Tax=Flavobacterium columnare TaxID=996 RepID=A0A437UEQ3_9FLAO|nr:SDR family oxidoreductase [Flavobacterium columnare]RVU91998.1 SDR family NAD(P)-dependent oxidoreductase [Flavobacterium columnare]